MWLEADTVLPLAGYDSAHPKAAAAVAYAEGIIEGHTRLIYGRVEPFVHHVRLTARSMGIPLPRDAQSITLVSAAGLGNIQTTIQSGQLILLDRYGFNAVWPAGNYSIAGMRGLEVIPEDINKAASLLAAHYLGLSDPDRSRYDGAMMGDFAGTMRLSALPVPEAQALLSRYVSDVAVG